MNNPADTLAALADIRLGIEMDARHMDDAPAKLAALDAALASLKGEAVVPALEVFRVAGGDVECCPNPTAAEAMDCLRDLRQCYEESLTTPPAPQAVGEDRDRLVGSVLDAWEMLPNDVKHEVLGCALGKQLNALRNWMENDQPVPDRAEGARAKRKSTTPSPAPQGGGEAICEALVNLVEGHPVHRWAADGVRLKDAPEWVAFYNLVRRLK